MRRPTEEEIDLALAETFPASDQPAFPVGDDPPSSLFEKHPHLAAASRAASVGDGGGRMTDDRLVQCPACGSTNRVALGRLEEGLAPRCGRCKADLPVKTGPVIVTDATFADLVEGSALPVVVDMWAPWCGPCRMLAPVLDELAVEMAGRVRFSKLNVDENPLNAARFDARRIPLLVIFKNGREVDRVVGLMPKAALAARLEQTLGG